MKAYMQSLFLPGWSTKSVATLRRVGLWLIGWEVRGERGGGVHYPIGRSFGLLADGDGEFCCSGMSSQLETTLLAATSTRSLPLMFVCPLILCSIVVSPSSDLYMRESTIAAISGL